MNRYDTKRRYWQNFPPRITVVWTGFNHFFAEQKYQPKPQSDDIQSAPLALQPWEEWTRHIQGESKVAHMLNTHMTYELVVSTNPYAFSMKAYPNENPPMGATVIDSLKALGEWQVMNGMHPEDVPIIGTGPIGFLWDWFASSIAMLERLGIGKLTAKIETPESLGWLAWGGEL